MKFTNKEGASRFGRYRIVPSAGNDHLDAQAAAKKSANFLFDELKEKSPLARSNFASCVQLANAGDVVDDATVHWPADRTLQELGKLPSPSPSPTTPPSRSRSSSIRSRGSMGSIHRPTHSWNLRRGLSDQRPAKTPRQKQVRGIPPKTSLLSLYAGRGRGEGAFFRIANLQRPFPQPSPLSTRERELEG